MKDPIVFRALLGLPLLALALCGFLVSCETEPAASTDAPYAPISSYPMDPANGISAEQAGKSQDPWEVQRWQYQEMQKLMRF